MHSIENEDTELEQCRLNGVIQGIIMSWKPWVVYVIPMKVMKNMRKICSVSQRGAILFARRLLRLLRKCNS